VGALLITGKDEALPAARLAIVTAALWIVSAPSASAQDRRSSPDTLAGVAASAGQQPARPRIGLALGGGAARGLAHIGLLRWFEEHRIPIDVIAGTSMGGLIGGGYATGLSPDEIQAVMHGIDWDLAFLADSPYRYKTFRRKEDARAFPGQIDFGIRGGFTLPSGLNAGQQIELVLDHIALPYYDVADFDDLPTPFRSVAADIRKAEPVVLDSGPLSRALRATMALPAVFTPVVVGDQVLVDGGALNNVPADVARSMGADVVIAVNVSSTTDVSETPTTLFSVFGQTIDAMMVSATRQALKSADLLIVPDLNGFTSIDWRRTDELVARGYQAAAGMSDQLLKYQVSESDYAAWRGARQKRRRPEMPPVAGVVVEGLPPGEAERLTATLEARHAGRLFTRADVEDSLLRISGTDRYEVISYTLRAGEKGPDLVVRITPKSYGPPFLLPALDIQNIDSTSFAVSLRVRLVAHDVLLPDSEVRLDGGIGTNQTAALEYYKLIGGAGFFVAPRAYFLRSSLNGYNDDGELLAEYREKRTGAGFDVGYTTGLRSEVRLGYDVADVRVRLRVGTPALPEATGQDRFATLRWVFDGQNSPIVPSSGLRVRTTLRYYFETPDLVAAEDQPLESYSDVLQGEVTGSWFTRVAPKQRLFVSGGAGTSFDRNPGVNEFRLGGPLRLGAFNNGQIRGDNYLQATVGLLYEWFRLPDVLGGNTYIGGWLEQGSAFDTFTEADYRGAGSVGVVMETILGPAFVGFSQSITSGDRRFYVALAPFLP
jgi:NTE family protein